MLNEKLLTILKMLPPKHFKRLQRATLSSFHDGNSNAQKMYKALSSYYPNFELSPKDIRKIYSKLFPGKTFNPKALTRYTDALLKTTEAFLIHLKLENDNFLHEKLISNAFSEPDLFDLFVKSQAKCHEILDAKEQKDANYWEEKTALFDSLYAHVGHEKYDVNDETLTKLNEASNRFYLHYSIPYYLMLKEKSPIEDNDLIKQVKSVFENGEYGNDEILNNYF